MIDWKDISSLSINGQVVYVQTGNELEDAAKLRSALEKLDLSEVDADDKN